MNGIIGSDPLPYGVKTNRATLEVLIRYNVDQEVIPEKVSVEDVFEPNTFALID